MSELASESLARRESAFHRIAIVNRGEPAMRLIHAVREWNAEGRSPLRTIALHTAVDRRAMFVREADEAVLIGPDDPDDLGASPYLDHEELERALRAARADAAWPGWGFVSEKAEFAELCRRLDIVFIGPPPEVMRRLGDKIAAKRLAEDISVPLAAWSSGPVADVTAAREHAEKIGYPLMVKATAGGGGRGIRLVSSPDELDEAFERASSEAAKTAGDATMFLERAVRGGRHVEVQIIADTAGTVWTLGVRDCSVQRRNQKVIEESASTALDTEQEELLCTFAAELARAAGYVSAGTVEFLYEPKERLLSFLEVNTRLQVEHPVTEMTTGVDIVKLQLHIASGGQLSEVAAQAPAERGHAIEARLTAEDPEQGFTPAPGLIEHLTLPNGPGIRVDTGVTAGDLIPPQFDSMIAKVIAWGQDRTEALARLSRALHQTAAVIDGGSTNKAFLLDLLDRPEIRCGDTDTTWLDTMMADGYAPPRRLDVALLAAAVEAQEAHVARQRERLFISAERGRPDVGHETWHQVDVRAGGHSYRLRVAQTRGSQYRVELDGGRAGEDIIEVKAEHTGRFERRLTVGEHTYAVLSVPQGPDYLVEVDGAVHRISGGEAGLVRAPAPAMVVAIPVQTGDPVEVGDVVAVVESMKLETALRAPVTGRVREVLVAPNTQVEAGMKLIRLEPDPSTSARSPDDAQATPGQRADFAALAGSAVGSTHRDTAATHALLSPAAAAADALMSLRFLVLGYDIDERDAQPLLAAHSAARADLPGDDPVAIAGELAVLQIFADLCALSRNRRGVDGSDHGFAENGADAWGAETRNPQEYLYAYLRSRDADVEGLPESFRAKLRRALAHYGVPDLEPSAELSSALYRMFLAHRRAAVQVPVILELLQCRLRHPTSLPPAIREGYQRTLDDLITATQLRYPVVGGLARRVRFRCFDAPLIAAARARGHQQVRAELERMTKDPADPTDPSWRTSIDAIVAAAEPILGVFGSRHYPAMIEVMTRRYYRIRTLTDLRIEDRGGRPLLTASYCHDGTDHVVLATTVHTAPDAPTGGDPLSVQGDLRRLIAALPAGRTVLLDLYVIAGEAPDADPERSAEKIRAMLGRLPERLGRIAVAVRRADGDERSAWFTFFPAGSTGGPRVDAASDRRPVEDRTLRGLHPMVAERLGLWRLSGFELTRLPSPIDVHLFRAVGKQVPDERRLIALSDVRDLTVVRGVDGRIRAVPQLEHVLDSCLDSLRAARAADRADAKLEWNRLLLYVWPVVDLPLEDFDAIVRTLAPRTDALGLEQVMVQFRTSQNGSEPQERMLRLSRPPGAGLTVRVTDPPPGPLRELDAYAQKVIRARLRGAVYPYELVPMLLRNPDRGGPPGTFTEYDLDATGAPVIVERPPGTNTANLVLGTVTTATQRYPEGMTRVVLIGDPTKALGAIAEPECRRVLAAMELARRLGAGGSGVPIEWFAVSAGAKIAMDSGTENMDWISQVLRGLIEFTQAGGEINIVVTGINVGAQPYWNAEATMLMHTKGILVMTPDATMVLTGKQSLDFSGGVSAEDNFGIGGYDRIMGPNGQAQYWAPDLSGAVDVLLAHYDHTYRAPGERFPRPAPTSDPVDRDVSDSPHSGPGCDFETVGEIFSSVHNPERKKPFDIHSVLRAVADADHPTVERWADMIDAEGVVVLDAHLGGQPIALLGIESRPLPRRGRIPTDGPTSFTAGTLFPKSSKKTARAINAASGNRPLVVLANLSGFDGSPESLRGLQLEYGAEIGRAVVNFDGPIVFCVVSRYHGGAFVVFSGTLNDNMEVAAVEGSYASVIGGAPAAAVVFAGEVNRRTAADRRIADLGARIADAQQRGAETESAALTAELATLRPAVRSEKLGQVADEFDAAHSVQRAHRMGSVHTIIPANRLRPYLIDAVQRGMAKY